MEVRQTCRWVAEHASHVSIHEESIEKVAAECNGSLPDVKWNFENIHFSDNGPLTAQYILVLDALNFCFWPDDDLQYEHLARGLKEALEADSAALDAKRLQSFTGPQLQELLRWPRKLPLQDERVRLIREVGLALENHFGGLASNLITASKGSALALVELIACYFPGFRDHAVYKSHQVFVYKRAQIFVADIWGAFQGQGLGEFRDIDCITMFADYVVPAVLRQKGILQYNTSLAKNVDNGRELAAGSEEEVEIRACTITAVEQLREILSQQLETKVTSVQIDWWLWASGIESIHDLKIHHTRTVYY